MCVRVGITFSFNILGRRGHSSFGDDFTTNSTLLPFSPTVINSVWSPIHIGPCMHMEYSLHTKWARFKRWGQWHTPCQKCTIKMIWIQTHDIVHLAPMLDMSWSLSLSTTRCRSFSHQRACIANNITAIYN